MDEDEWITYDVEDDLELWLDKVKPSQILQTSSSKVCGIAISVPISSDNLNNNKNELEEEFKSLTSQKYDMRLLYVEEQATTVFVSTDKLLLKVNSHHVDDVWRGIIMNLHQGQFGQKVHRVEVSLAADINEMKTDYVICVYNENFTGNYQSLNGKIMKENNNDPVIYSSKKNKKAKINKPCASFNEGSCKVATTHLSQSRLTRWVHICEYCFAKYGDEKPHPESQCEDKKNADKDENITKSKEGSKFTLVTRNVYPTCSCRGGIKGCNTKACNCIKFSQECLPSCGCGQSCNNMGLTREAGKQIRIGQSRVQGDGCFAEEDIGKGEYVGEYTGELVLRADQLNKENPSKFLFEIGHKDFLLDAEKIGSKLAKMNHKTEKTGANCVYKLKRANGEWRVGVWAFKNIKKDEELFANYSSNYRGHGLFTPTKNKNKKRRKKGCQVEGKERQRPLIENQLPQSPSPAPFISNEEVTRSSPSIQRKTRSLVSKENSFGAIPLIDLSTPTGVVGGRAISVVGGRAISVTGRNSSASKCDSSQPSVLNLDSPNKTTQNQSINAELPIAKTAKLFEEKVKSNLNVATKKSILNANKENVRMPTVTITPKENDICKVKLYEKLSEENVRMPTVTITPEENDICKGKLDNKLFEENVKSIPNVASKMTVLNANKENVRMPTVTITLKENYNCKRKLYDSMTPVRSTPKTNVTPVRSSPRIKATPLRSTTGIKATPVRSSPRIQATPLRSTSGFKLTPVRNSPRIKTKTDEDFPLRSLVVDYNNLSFNPGDVEEDNDEEERT